MVSIDLACARKPVLGEPRLDTFDHGINAAATVTPHQGIDIACVVRPDSSDKVTPAAGVSLIPHGNVAINELGNVVHLGSPLCFSSSQSRQLAVRTHCARSSTTVDYARGNAWHVARGFSARPLNAGAPVDAPWLSSRRRERGAAQGPRRSWLRTQTTQLAPSVGHDPGMIKRQLQGRPMLHPLGSRGVAASLRARAHDARQEGHGTRMSARIASWIGVDADEPEPARLDPGFLQQLAPAGVLDGLADVHEAARQGILAGIRRV